MKNFLLLNQLFGTEGSPNQTGKTLTRENRIGLMSYLRRTLMLLFAVLTLSIANVGLAWGTTTSSIKLGYGLFDGISSQTTVNSSSTYSGTSVQNTDKTFTISTTLASGVIKDGCIQINSGSNTATVTITAPAGGTMTSIAGTFGSGKMNTVSTTPTNTNESPISSNTYTWTGSANSVTFNLTSGASANTEFKSIVITYSVAANKRIYMKAGEWNNASPYFYAHSWGSSNSDVLMTLADCETDVYYADIPSGNTSVLFTRQNTNSGIKYKNETGNWNQSADITISTNDKFTFSAWDVDGKSTFTGGTYSAPTYTISFNNGGGSGSMSNISSIACGADQTLPANTFTKSGYTFDGWHADVATTVSGSPVAVGSDIANQATLQNITSNIVLTAQWEEVECPESGTLYSLTVKSATYSVPATTETNMVSDYATVSGGGAYIGNKNATAGKAQVKTDGSGTVYFNGVDAYVKLALDCPIQTGDQLTFENGSGSNQICFTTTNTRATTYYTTSNSYTFPAVFNDANTIYVWRKSDNSTYMHSLTITRPSGECSATQPGTISKGTLSACTLRLTAAGSPETNNTWYWQSSESGTDKTESGATKDVTAAGTYYIRSYCSTGSGCWSDARSIVVSASDLTPAAPTALAKSSVTAKGVKLTVTDPANTNNYDLYVSTSNTAPTSGSTPTYTISESKSKTITNLVAGTTYYAWARAKCGSNKSTWTALGDGGNFTTSTVTVTHTLTNVTMTSGATTAGGSDYTAVFAAVSGYSMPTPTITVDGNTLSAGNYTWSDGTLTIPANKINGDIDITLNSAPAAPSSVSVTGNYHIYPGDDLELTATPSGGNGPKTYQWQKYMGSEWTDLDGETSNTYTKENVNTTDVGHYRCIVTCAGSYPTTSGQFDVKCLQLYVYYNNTNIDLTNMPFTKVDDTHAYASVLLSNSSYCYHFKVTDGCGNWWGNNGESGMSMSNHDNWSLNGNHYTKLWTSKAGTYRFNLGHNEGLTSYGMSVVFPSGDQTAGYNLYFANDGVNWDGSKIYYRIGKSNHNNFLQMNLVPGTANLYKVTTTTYGGFEAWHIANNKCGGNSTSIYLTNTNDDYEASEAMMFNGTDIASTGLTVIPDVENHWAGTGDGEGCEFYGYNTVDGMLTHTATVGATTNGSIRLNWTDVSGTAQNATATTAGLAHTCNLQITAVPATGYETTTLTVNGSNYTSGNVHVLSADATIAATFSPQTYSITYKDQGNVAFSGTHTDTPSAHPTSHTYNTATNLNGATKAGYTFDGWYTTSACTGDPVTSLGATAYTADITLYAKWTAAAGTTYYLVTSTAQLNATDTYIIANSGGTAVMSTTTADTDKNPDDITTGFSVVGSTLTVTSASPNLFKLTSATKGWLFRGGNGSGNYISSNGNPDADLWYNTSSTPTNNTGEWAVSFSEGIATMKLGKATKTTYHIYYDATNTKFIQSETASNIKIYTSNSTPVKTEPTVTWTGVPATVYPGQQFTFTVETNSDASLDVANLTATNATLVNKSIDGSVFTATAQIAANASSAPTFTLSTAAGTSYAAKDDTKSGITLGSCASSSGTATLFAFTCTSTTTAINTYSATGGTATLSGSAMSDKITIDKIDYYKFNSSSQWTMALSSGTFAVGDVITFTMACNTGSDKEDRGVKLNGSIAVTTDYPSNTAQESSYEVVADDGIAGQNSFTIKRNDSDIKFGSITITRAGQTISSKQETTIEWPETVDGVRTVEFEEGLKVPSSAIISSIGTPEYSSNNEDVGSFRDGNVELTGTGNVTITVSVPAVGCMEAAESSYVLTVTNKRYTVEKGTITGTGCDVTISATSVPSGDIVTLTPVPASGYSLTSWDVYKKDDSNTKVTVTNNRFTMPAYDVVVNATFSVKSTDATLRALTVTNTDTGDPVTLSPTFASGTTAYTATLSCGTTSAPSISATKNDSKASVRLTNVSDLSSATAADRTARIVVTAEDGATTQTYTIVFTVSNEDCERLTPTITSISDDENICSGGMVDLAIEAVSRNNDGGTLSYQWQKYNTSTEAWDNIAGATETEYTSDEITAETQFRCVVTDTKDASAVSTNSDPITIGVTSIATPIYTQSANVVTLSCATEGATIWYSTDGSTPAANADNSRQGTSVSITSSGVTVKAIAYLDGCHSDVMTLSNADYSAGSVAGSITWAMTNAGKKEAPKFSATCVPNTVLSAATAFQLSRGATYDKDQKENMSVKISGITSYDANGKHVTLAVTVAEGYTFTPCSLSVDYQPVSKAAKYTAVIGSNTSTESSSVSGGSHSAKIVNFTSATPISGTDSLHLYVYGTDLVTWRVAGNIILYGTVQATGTTYYSVTYNRNGATSGTVPVDDNRYANGDEVELAANTGGLAKDGHIFSGWATTPGGEVLTSNPTISSSDLTLYAVWTEDKSAQTEACANVATSGTKTSIAVGDYSLYFSSSNTEYNSLSVKSSTANKCDGVCRYYMPGVVVALTNSNASTIKLKGQQDYDVTVSKVMVADALDGAWREISYTPIAYKSKDCGVLGISGVQIAQGKYVFLGFSGGAKNEFRISGLCITPFVDACPAITIVNNPVGDTWAQGATGVQISVGATTASGTLTYQWQESTDNTNFSNITSAEAATFAVPTGTVGTKYYRCVVSNESESCSKNSESAKMVIVEPTVTALYDYWYIKQGRLTPDIALFEVTKGTPASNVTIPAAEIGKYGFVYNTSDYKIYLQGSAPSAIYSDEDVEVTASIKSNSNADNITLHLLRSTTHPQLAFVVTNGTGEDGFENYNADQINNDLYKQLAVDYIIQPTNIYYTTDEKAIRAYYSQFDIILNTDYPDTQKSPSSDKGQWNVGYVNALGTMVDIVPILTMEAFISRLPNWKIKQDPKSPSTNQYKMLLNCRAHEIFTGIPDGNMGEETINGEEHKVVTIVDENGYDTKNKALQGFAADDLADMDVVGQIHNGSGQLMACVERQYETTARMMVLGINSSAMEKLTEDGIKVVKNALLYLQHKSAKEVNDCSVKFTNNDGAGDGQWSTASNWSTGVVPSHENKVIILANCELDAQAHVDMVKINEDVKLTIKPTGALIVDGTITRFSGDDWLAQEGNITSDNLVVEADESHSGALILSNPDSKVGAEVQMYSKGRHYDGVYNWQYVAVPLVSASRWNMGDWAYVFNNAGGDWNYNESVYNAFEAVGVTRMDAELPTYTFSGPLASTRNQTVTLYTSGVGNGGFNMIGNSWTAPIQIANFMETDFGSAVYQVKIYNTGHDPEGGAVDEGTVKDAPGKWKVIPITSMKEAVEGGTWNELTVIPSLQTFEVQNATETNTTLTLDYDRLVRTLPTTPNLNEPKRVAQRLQEKKATVPQMRITLKDGTSRENLYLFSDEQFNEGFDNGWDGAYESGESGAMQIYMLSPAGNLSISAQPEMEGTTFGFEAGRKEEYTFSFKYVGDEELYFNDLQEKKSTLINDENEYTFTAQEGESGIRFMISATPFDKPGIATGGTDLDAEAPKVQKVIYNDKLYIIRGGKVFSAEGQLVR